MTLRHLPFLLGLLTLPAIANDLFIGTVQQQGALLIMTRCDLVKNRYLLLDPPGSTESATRMLRQRPAGEGPLYIEIFAKYTEHNQQNALLVESVRKLQPGKSCHLDDLLNTTP